MLTILAEPIVVGSQVMYSFRNNIPGLGLITDLTTDDNGNVTGVEVVWEEGGSLSSPLDCMAEGITHNFIIFNPTHWFDNEE